MKYIKKLIFSLLIILFFLFNNEISYGIQINSGAALLVETSTDRVLYEKNSTKRMYPASVTKILTAILVLEKCNLDDTVTVSYNAVHSIPTGYVNANLQPGEVFTIRDLLNVLMVRSANDVAVALAEHIAGSVEAFSDMMNTRAKELGCTDTHFVNPNGIHNDNHYTTAYDLYLMAKHGMQNEIFRKIVSQTSCKLPATDKYPNDDRISQTTNELIKINNSERPDNYYYKYATGIKTGFTTEAKNCLVASSCRDNLEFISVILSAGTLENGLSARYLDTIHLLDYGYDNFTITKIKEANSIVNTVEVDKATKETKNLNLLIQDEITVINNKTTDAVNTIPSIEFNESLQAPIAKGDVVGTITYKIDDIEYSSKLLASENVVRINYIGFYLLFGGIILLVFAMVIMPKRHRKKNYRKQKN